MSEMVLEAINYFRSYGVKCDDDDKWVQEWLNSDPSRKGSKEAFCEVDIYDFNEWCRWKGTAYEKGIDDQTKIERLLKEINELKSEIIVLREQNNELEARLGMNSF